MSTVSAATRDPRTQSARWVLLLPFVPCLLALNLPPSPTLLNQCFALGLWGACMTATGARLERQVPRDVWPLMAALVLIAMGSLLTLAFGAMPTSIGVANVAIVLSALAVVLLGRMGAERPDGAELMASLLSGLCAVGAISALIAFVQVFAPALPDGDWIARTALPGRGVGNLRQPNHLASLLLWAAIAAVALLELGRLPRRAAWPLLLLLLSGVVLTGSRTGLLGTLLLSAWAIADRRLSRANRILLLMTPLFTAALWMALSAWAHGGPLPFSGEARLSPGAGGDISSSRFAIWSDTLVMLSREPLSGVGFGEFNLAWTLSELPHRPVAFFDHTHNLPLQLMVELGLPLGSAVVALLLWAAWLAGRRAWQSNDDDAVVRRAAVVLVVMIGLHSMLEYPLWYAHFLLPTAYVWGFALAPALRPGMCAWPRSAPAIQGIGLAMTLGAAAAVLDYRQIVVIYEPPEGAAALEQRIERGQRSLLFGHHADYAAATAFGDPEAPLSASQQLAFRRAPHHLLDVRLMIAWAQALAAEGKTDQARWLAARIREFRNPGADEFFAPCAVPAEAAQAFQCQLPQRAWHWREFVSR